MAEEILRRVAALRLAAALAVALTIAGFSTRDTIRMVSGTAGSGVPKNSIGSNQVRNHSLTAKDFKLGSVLTPGQANHRYLKIGEAKDTYLKLSEAQGIKLQVAEIAGTIKQIGADLATAINKLEANYLKIDDFSSYKDQVADQFNKLDGTFMMGDGSVRTGMVKIVGPDKQTLLDLPGLAGIAVDTHKSQVVDVTNNSGGPMTVVGGGHSIPLDAGETAGILIGLDEPTPIQLITGGTVSTVTVSGAPGPESTLFTGQALVGGS